MEKFEKYYKYGFLIAILAIIALCYKSCSDSKELKSVKVEALNVTKALTDTLHHFKTKEGDWGVEKKTIQAELSTLKDANLNLNSNQKLLIKEVERQNKTATTIAAALIELTAKVEGLTNDNAIVGDSTVNFPFTSKDLQYNLTVFNVKPIDFKKPRLTINTLSFPNTQTVNFNWKDDKREGFPVSFSVVNTNQYFKVSNIESYIIPSINKKEIHLNVWQRFTKSKTFKWVIFGAGITAGVFVAK